jgi:hypothetical protein
MGVLYVTDGSWGTGVHRLLQPNEIDGNFFQVAQDIAAKAVQGVGIDHFVVTGNQLYVYLTDHTIIGPYTLPIATITFIGNWVPNSPMLTNQIFTYNGSTYIVLVNHTSAATFDPNDNDGMGHNFYGLLLQNPSMVIPAGGAVGQFLRKASSADYSVAFENATLNDLIDVAVSGAVNGDYLTFHSGVWGATPLVVGDTISPGSPLEAGEPVVYNGSIFTNSPKVDLPCGAARSVSGAVTIDRSVGEIQRLSVTANVTSIAISNWPPTGQAGRLILEIVNTGAFTLAWPSARWAGGVVPVLTHSGRDLYGFLSFDGGSTVYGNTIGQGYV